jgi:tetratricopeptide (TPR) repeat protein
MFARWWVVLSAVLLTASAEAAAKGTRRSAAQSQAVVGRVLGDVTDLVWTHGDYYWHEGRYEDQVAICRLVRSLDPGYAEAYSSGAWLLENLGRDDEALALYREGARAVPNDWHPHHDLGYFYYQHKRYPEAIESLKKAVALGPPAYVWHMLAHSYDRSGDREQAIATWRRCLKLYPDDGAAQANLRRLEERSPPPDAADGADST